MGKRLFFALNINDETRGRIVSAIDRLRAAPGRVKWTKAKNLHVTMNFVGDVPDKRIAELCDLAKKTVADWASDRDELNFTVGPLICFPPGKRAKMIWAPITEGGEVMASLNAAMNQALAEGGWPNESRPFTGHVTVARIKDGDLRQPVASFDGDDMGAVTATELTLYASDLTRTGPIYSALAGFPFADKR